MFDLSQTSNSFGAHHRFGWDKVRDKLCNFLIHNPDGILLDMFCERTFFWNPLTNNKDYYHNKPWIGFIHSTPHNYKTFDNNASNLPSLLKNEYFIKSLVNCICLFVLSKENKDYLDNYFIDNNINIKVFTILHPCELSDKLFVYNN